MQSNNNRKLGFVLLFFISLLFTLNNFGQTSVKFPQKLSADEVKNWREDLQFLATELPRRHKNLFFTMTQQQFSDAIKRLDEKIPSLTKYQVALEFQKIVAMVQDGHTWLLPIFDPAMNFHALPVKLYVFKDGIFVQKASPEYANIVGGKVLRIGNTPIEKAIEIVSPYLPKENEMGEKDFAPMFLISPEILQALGITNDLEKAEFQIEKQGKTFTTEVKLDAKFSSMRGVHTNLPDGWVDARSNSSNPTPLWLKNADDGFWFEYLKDTKIVYVQLNQVLNKDDKTIAQFFDEIKATVETNGAKKLVLDIRQNGGGNNGLVPIIIRSLVQMKDIDQRGNLFVIIGRQTFSAAQNLTNELEKYTNAIFVGEPTASHVNMYGDAARFTLPNSKLTGQASTLWWQNMSERDTRKWTAPEIAAELTFADYANNIDAAMKAVIEYKPQKSLREIATELLQANDLKSFKAKVIEYKNNPINAYLNFESEINTIGYRLLGMKKNDEAVEIFKLNVELYPESFNVYDSLAEGYMNQGNKELAIKFYKKSLEINPNNTNAIGQIEALEKK
ncbi:hypothetical protein BH10ACI1_BH10ACI1_06010 [soil metagenome]